MNLKRRGLIFAIFTLMIAVTEGSGAEASPQPQAAQLQPQPPPQIPQKVPQQTQEVAQPSAQPEKQRATGALFSVFKNVGKNLAKQALYDTLVGESPYNNDGPIYGAPRGGYNYQQANYQPLTAAMPYYQQHVADLPYQQAATTLPQPGVLNYPQQPASIEPNYPQQSIYQHSPAYQTNHQQQFAYQPSYQQQSQHPDYHEHQNYHHYTNYDQDSYNVPHQHRTMPPSVPESNYKVRYGNRCTPCNSMNQILPSHCRHRLPSSYEYGPDNYSENFEHRYYPDYSMGLTL